MLTQNNLLSNAQTLVDAWRFTEGDVLLHAPIFTHGLFVATNIILLAGASMIFLPKFEVDSVFAFLPQATSMMGVPTFYTRLLMINASLPTVPAICVFLCLVVRRLPRHMCSFQGAPASRSGTLRHDRDKYEHK